MCSYQQLKGVFAQSDGWLDEAYGDLTNQTFQNSTEPNLLFVFIFSFLKPNQRFGGVQLISYTS